jgi:group I intron endonuclease
MLYPGYNLYLQYAIAKYGLANFTFCVIEYCDLTILIEREQHYLNLLFYSLARKLIYNSSPTAVSNLGYKHTEEARANISKAQRGSNHPFYSKTHTQKTKAKLSEANSEGNNPKYSTISPTALKVYVYSPENVLFRAFFHV